MNNKTLLRVAISVLLALPVSISLLLPARVALAQSQDGSVSGRTEPGAEVTIRDPEKGFVRSMTASSDGSFRFPFLPVGQYTLDARKDGQLIADAIPVSVILGKGTFVNAGAEIDEIRVVAARGNNAIDVTSTESASNFTQQELARIPVDRDPLAVAQLAPGVTKGEFGGASFSGSSVAENAVYINGLNVTDFYNRVGFSTIPYAFYDQFQIKTAGYSVEFGRTTGGVINAVTKSGTNNFDIGAEVVWEPSFLQGTGDDHYDSSDNPVYIASYDDYDRQNLTLHAGGPIIRDKLFFFALYEFRNYEPVNTSSSGNNINKERSDDAFWGAKIDWQMNDNNLVELLAFSDGNSAETKVYQFDSSDGSTGSYQNTALFDDGGINWSASYTGYLTDTFSVRAMYGENDREFSQYSLNDLACNRVRDLRTGGAGDIGCTSTSTVRTRVDNREQARLDFQWSLGDHQVRFGVDHEVNVSDHQQYYPGPERLLYEIRSTTPGATLENGGVVPAGVTAYVRSRTNEVAGEFETTNIAYYLEDSWQVTDNLLIDLGVRVDSFDNKNSDGDSYIKIDNMIGPRIGFALDTSGEGRSKFFGNYGRYFLPVANVINIKQAGGFADVRTFYEFQGLEDLEYDGAPYQVPILGAQIGAIDNSQGDGSVGDLRGEVDADMDPVYQDEFILGYQSMLNDQWSWGVRGIYRDLTNAIDDMEITSNGLVCGNDTGYVNWIMGNPGEPATVYTDTDCDGDADGYITIDTSQAGWGLYDDDGNYVGEAGFATPKRTYKALEFVIDRAWDDHWAFNGSYTLAYSEGNAEGPVNSDTDFADAGRTENFDDPWVNLNGEGYLPNDRRHQIKLRGAYGIGDYWELGATLNVQSGGPINRFGVGNPYDDENYHSNFVCVANCTSPNPSEREYESSPRASGGRLPWTYSLGMSVTYAREFSNLNLRGKFAVYNLLDQQRVIEVDDEYESDIGFLNPDYGLGTSYQSPLYAQFVVTLGF
jgi:outer membrane receptor protein involved in Fe transport